MFFYSCAYACNIEVYMLFLSFNYLLRSTKKFKRGFQAFRKVLTTIKRIDHRMFSGLGKCHLVISFLDCKLKLLFKTFKNNK